MKKFYDKYLKGKTINKTQFIDVVSELKQTEIKELLTLVNPVYLEQNEISIKNFKTTKK